MRYGIQGRHRLGIDGYLVSGGQDKEIQERKTMMLFTASFDNKIDELKIQVLIPSFKSPVYN